MDRFIDTSCPTRKVLGLQLAVLSPNEVTNNSVCQIVGSHEGASEKGKGHVFDARMGPTDTQKCATCGGDRHNCPGHFGHINLVRPVYHFGFMDTVLKLLRSVCHNCSRLLIQQDDPHPDVRETFKNLETEKPFDRLDAISVLAQRVKSCGEHLRLFNSQKELLRQLGELKIGQPSVDTSKGGWADDSKQPNSPTKSNGCGFVNPKYTRPANDRILIKAVHKINKTGKGMDDDDVKESTPYLQDNVQLISAQKARLILQRVSDDECQILGLNPDMVRPEWLILTALPVMPPVSRPSVKMGALTGHDDLTHKYSDIVKTNNQLRLAEARGAPEHVVEDMVKLVQYHVTTFYHSDIKGLPPSEKKGGGMLRDLRSRLTGKGGRLRSHLMGKRGDFTARTPIGGDPQIGLSEVGIPMSVAQNLTFPERVTERNIEQLQKLVLNGPSRYPGAKLVIRNESERVINLAFVKNLGEVVLLMGDIVERSLVDGDVVFFNRQPSLHKMSVMSHRVKVLPFSTFRMNLSATPPYNADFDGDEMNLFVPQSVQAVVEALELTMVHRQIVSPAGSRPVISIVQDTLLGVMKFSQRDCFLERPLAYNLMSWIDTWDGIVPAPAILKPKPLWTGKQILSMMLPDTLNFTRYSSTRPDEVDDLLTDETNVSRTDTQVFIEKGTFLTGIVDKRTVGSSAGSLIHVLFNDYGPSRTGEFIDGLQVVICQWLLQAGFSIGIGDTINSLRTLDLVRAEIDEVIGNVNDQLIPQARRGEIERMAGCTMKETFESTMVATLSRVTDNVGTLVRRELPDSNGFKQAMNAGSKGNPTNITQICACVGQQSLLGERVKFGFQQRALPHFSRGDISPEARGFVRNSYLQGLTPQELFFHAMAGRVGLVDTAVKTGVSGYIQRRLTKAMEDLQITYDGTVRNSAGQVLQFLYGEDGYDAQCLEKHKLNFLFMDEDKFDRRFSFSLDSDHLSHTVRSKLLEDVDTLNAVEKEIKALRDYRTLFRSDILPGLPVDADIGEVYLPVNFNRLIWAVHTTFTAKEYSDMCPLEAIELVDGLCNRLNQLQSGDKDEVRVEQHRNAMLVLMMAIRSTLSSRNVIAKHRISRSGLAWIVGEIEHKVNAAAVPAGEMVGTLAAQSISEPATQMTLNTFHFTGQTLKTVQGVPRLEELIGNTASKGPSLTIYLNGDYARSDKNVVGEAIRAIEYVNLSDITHKFQVFYDPDPQNCEIEDDDSFLQDYFEIDDIDPDALGRWVLRFELDKKKKDLKRITGVEISTQINKMFEDELICFCPGDNAEKQVLHIRQVVDPDSDDSGEILEPGFMQQIGRGLLKQISLRGVRGIQKIFASKGNKWIVDEKDGGLKKESECEWVLHTEGANLREVLKLDCVDSTRTFSNNITDIFEVFGIEAARKALCHELKDVMSMAGSFVNPRHLFVLADSMTTDGVMMPITYYGLAKRETGPLMKCSFERTTESLLKAAVSSELDPLTDPSSQIIMGQLSSIGTGFCEMLLDTAKLKRYAPEYSEPPDIFAPATREIPWGNDIMPMPNNFEGLYGSPIPHGVTFSPPIDYSSDASGASDSGIPRKRKSPVRLESSPLSPGFSSYSGSESGSPLSSYSPTSPSHSWGSPDYHPTRPDYHPRQSSHSPTSPYPSSPSYLPTSPSYLPTSPSYLPTSPSYSPISPSYSATSPPYSPISPSYSPTSPTYSPSPSYSPTSPSYSPTSPNYSPTSPGYSPTSPGYSPTSPSYSPTSPNYSPTSPNYSPTSPLYSPTSPVLSPTSPSYSPSPSHSPTSPYYSPTSPTYSPTSPSYSPTSPSYSPASPTRSPSSQSSSPSYSPTSPFYSRTSPGYSRPSEHSASSPEYSPSSPEYSPSSPEYSFTPPAHTHSPAETGSPVYQTSSPESSPTSSSSSPPNYSSNSSDTSPSTRGDSSRGLQNPPEED